MDAFTYRDGELYAEDVPVRSLAESHGTPLYIYSRNHLREQFQTLVEAMAEVDPLICYSVKANSNSAVIGTLLAEGSGLDVVSGGELYRALRAGADPAKIVFAGVGKTREEMAFALNSGIFAFNVESEPELRALSEMAGALGRTARIAFRKVLPEGVIPDLDMGLVALVGPTR